MCFKDFLVGIFGNIAPQSGLKIFRDDRLDRLRCGNLFGGLERLGRGRSLTMKYMENVFILEKLHAHEIDTTSKIDFKLVYQKFH